MYTSILIYLYTFQNFSTQDCPVTRTWEKLHFSVRRLGKSPQGWKQKKSNLSVTLRQNLLHPAFDYLLLFACLLTSIFVLSVYNLFYPNDKKFCKYNASDRFLYSVLLSLITKSY